MAIKFNNFITITKYWADFKSIVNFKNLVIQYEEDGDKYLIFAIETETQIVYICTIWKGTLLNEDVYTQSQNDTDKSDFESNYKSLGNRPTQITARFGYTPTTLSKLIKKTVRDSNDSEDLLVDGSSTPVVFTFSSSPVDDIGINEIRFLFSAQAVTFDGDSFGPIDILGNGIKVEAISNNYTADLGLLKRTEDFVNFASVQGVWTEYGGKRDLLLASMFLDGAAVLKAGSSDKIKVTVQDDLASAKAEGTLKYLTCLIVARKLV